MARLCVLLLAAAAASGQSLIDTDFAGPWSSALNNPRASGELPRGWVENSNWANTWIAYSRLEEDGRPFLRIHVTRHDDGACQIYHPLPRSAAGSYLKLRLTVRNPDRIAARLGVRKHGSPYTFLWEETYAWPSGWSDQTYYVRTAPGDFDIGFFLIVDSLGTLDLARVQLEATTLAAIQRELAGRPAPPYKNLARNTRFPLGLQTGWTLDRDSSDGILVDLVDLGNGDEQAIFYDFQRGTPMLLLTILFVASIIVLGRWRGVGALAGLAMSLVVIVVFALPALLEGSNSVAVAIVTAGAIAFVALFLAHGRGLATAAALLSTFASLALTAILAWVFLAASKFTGFGDESVGFLDALGSQIDPRGLLLAGVVIGSLGVLDDVTVTQVSAVWELRRATPDANFGELYGRALRIGRDHISSTVNTLFLAYAGASLPLLLLFSEAQQGLGSVATREVVAVEIVRALVGSIGLVASVPISTALAAKVLASTSPTRPDQTAEPSEPATDP